MIWIGKHVRLILIVLCSLFVAYFVDVANFSVDMVSNLARDSVHLFQESRRPHSRDIRADIHHLWDMNIHSWEGREGTLSSWAFVCHWQCIVCQNNNNLALKKLSCKSFFIEIPLVSGSEMVSSLGRAGYKEFVVEILLGVPGPTEEEKWMTWGPPLFLSPIVVCCSCQTKLW